MAEIVLGIITLIAGAVVAVLAFFAAPWAVEPNGDKSMAIVPCLVAATLFLIAYLMLFGG